ncbi:MAG: hypothetical protein QM323_11630 [Acidobacteriota bacterium]|nr:hypothetical protein [Acidobacteriota bacterium]
MSLIFAPTTIPGEAWSVRDSATGMEVGTIEWHDRLGAYGFGSSRDMDLFRDASAMEEVARFLERVNVL